MVEQNEISEIHNYRKRFGIREATQDEIQMMTADQRWHYFAAAHKPHGVHFENFRHEGKVVRPIYLEREGKIGFGNKGDNKAGLRPMPIQLNEGSK